MCVYLIGILWHFEQEQNIKQSPFTSVSNLHSHYAGGAAPLCVLLLLLHLEMISPDEVMCVCSTIMASGVVSCVTGCCWGYVSPSGPGLQSLQSAAGQSS